MLMPTPSGFISLTASRTSTSKPARFRHIAAVRPPMPAPAMTIFMVSGVPAQAFEEKCCLVGSPALGLCVGKFAQVRPAVDAAVMLVVEDDADRVVADRLDGVDRDVAATRYQLLGGRAAMALHLGRRAFDAEVFRRQAALHAVGEIDVDARARLEHAQLLRPGRGLRLVAALVGNGFREVGGHELPVRWRASLTSMIGMPSRIG